MAFQSNVFLFLAWCPDITMFHSKVCSLKAPQLLVSGWIDKTCHAEFPREIAVDWNGLGQKAGFKQQKLDGSTKKRRKTTHMGCKRRHCVVGRRIENGCECPCVEHCAGVKCRSPCLDVQITLVSGSKNKNR